MANDSIDHLKVLSETDLFSTMSKSDYSSVHEDNCSWRYLAKTYFNNSKPLRNSISNLSIKDHSLGNFYKDLPSIKPISINQMLKAQNTNAPWLFNILKKKFHRSRKHKNTGELLRETEMNSSSLLAEELLERPISSDGTSSGRWIINERDVVFPLMKNFDRSTAGQYNISRAISSSTSPIPLSTADSSHLHHYHYDFQPLEISALSPSSFPIDHPPPASSVLAEETTESKRSNDQDIPVDFPSIASMVKTYYTTDRQQIDSNDTEEMEMTSPSSSPEKLEPITEDPHLPSGNSTIQTRSKRAKSASASARSPRRTIGSNTSKKGKRQVESGKKKKSKYYQEHLLSSEEIELREALRLIDLDNIGFFPPNELRKVLKEIGIHAHDIEKIERCLPLDEDGHYSIDNLIKLFLGSKN